MKKIISIAIAISVFFCFSITSFALPSPSSMEEHHSVINIKLSDANKATYDFYYNWHRLPINKKAVIADAGNNYNVGVTFIEYGGVFAYPNNIHITYTTGDNLAFTFDNKITYSRIVGSYDFVGSFSPSVPVSANLSRNQLTGTFLYMNVSGYAYNSYDWLNASTTPPWDFLKNSLTTITYDVDISKTYEEYQASLPPPPSSSSEPTTPPVDPPPEDDNSGLVDTIINGIKGIFIPSEDYFSNYFDDLSSALDSKIGSIKTVLNDLSDDFNGLVNSNEQQSLIFTLPDNHFYSGFDGFSVDFLTTAKPFLNFLRPILNGLMAVIVVIFCYKSITKMFE